MANLKILLIEDKNIDAMNIKHILESLNYEVPYVATSGEKALKNVLVIMPDIVLLDIAINGYLNVVSQIKKLNIPIILFNNDEENLIIDESMDNDSNTYLINLYNENSIKSSIEKALYREKQDSNNSQDIIITNAINKVLQNLLICDSSYGVAKICLDVAREITESDYGFIGELSSNGSFDTIALSDPGMDNCVMPKNNAVKFIIDMNLENYWASPLKTGKSIIVNNPRTEPDKWGVPEGHPPINSFLGVPLKQDGKAVGMVVLANKKSGYNHEDLQNIETLSVTFMEALKHKRAEITLQRSEDRFRAVAESSVDAIVTTDVNGVILFFNNSLKNIFGYNQEELTGKHITALMPERFKKTYLNELKRFKESGKHRLIGKTVHTKGLKKNGSEFPFEMYLSSWKSGEMIFFTSIIHDLTDKKKAEEELKWSQELLMMGMDMAKLVYWEYDIKTNMFTFDDQFYSLYGTSVEQEGGNQMSYKDYVKRFLPPGEQSRVGEEISRAIKSNDPNYSQTVQHRIKQANGLIMPIMVHIRTITDENDKVVGIRGVDQDITELKKAEDALAESNQRMEDIIEFLPDATFAIDHMGRVIFWNLALEEMTGIPSEEILGKGNYEYALPFYGIRRPLLIDLVKSPSEEINQHYRVPKRKGNVLTAETETSLRGELKTLWGKAVPFYDTNGDFVGAIEAIRDITEKKESRERIRRELEINKSLANIYTPLVSPSSTIGDVKQVIVQEAKKLTGSTCGFVSILAGFSISDLENKDKDTELQMEPDSMDCIDKLAIKISDAERHSNGILSQILSTQQSMFTNSPHDDPNYIDIPTEIKKILIVPVVLADELVGHIVLANPSVDYSEDDVHAIERLSVFYALAIQNKKAEQEIKKSLTEKELLLREIHHRVKNNMQIISSLLNLQILQVEGEKAEHVLKESQGRVKSMAMVHEKLYQSPSFNQIDIKDYVEKLVSNILFSYAIPGEDIKTEIDINDVYLDIDTAIPCGLIINELVTNSIKYAFPNKTGTLTVKLISEDDQMELIIADNGQGFPPDIDFENTDSLGLQLVVNLVRQIEGNITLDRSQGTKFTITFQELKYKERI